LNTNKQQGTTTAAATRARQSSIRGLLRDRHEFCNTIIPEADLASGLNRVHRHLALDHHFVSHLSKYKLIGLET